MVNETIMFIPESSKDRNKKMHASSSFLNFIKCLSFLKFSYFM